MRLRIAALAVAALMFTSGCVVEPPRRRYRGYEGGYDRGYDRGYRGHGGWYGHDGYRHHRDW